MKSDAALLEELGQATAGLLFMSEADYPFQTVRWEGLTEVTPQYLRDLTGRGADSPVASRSVDEFFNVAMSEQSWKGEAQLAEARRYQALVRMLRENLEDLRVYRVGEIDVAVFIVGRGPAGNWIGLSTRVIET